jgi:hypothetical protein
MLRNEVRMNIAVKMNQNHIEIVFVSGKQPPTEKAPSITELVSQTPLIDLTPPTLRIGSAGAV